MPRHLVIGDIHGCYAALEALAAYVPIRDDDLLVTLGDYVDRGPDSREVLDWLIKRHATGMLVPVLGNHEIMMLDARDEPYLASEWLEVGGRETLQSYATDGGEGRLEDVPSSHWQFLEQQTVKYYATESHIFVHANLLPDLELPDQPDFALFWEKFRNPPPHQSGRIMVCGHTPQPALTPLDIGHAICIDTWIYQNGWLTCLDPATGEFWQANQRRETRRDRLKSR
jgi:serine/threonine protein phosphatase 1